MIFYSGCNTRYRILAYRRTLPRAHSSSRCTFSENYRVLRRTVPPHLCRQGGAYHRSPDHRALFDTLRNWLSHNGLALNPSTSAVIQFSVAKTHKERYLNQRYRRTHIVVSFNQEPRCYPRFASDIRRTRSCCVPGMLISHPSPTLYTCDR